MLVEADTDALIYAWFILVALGFTGAGFTSSYIVNRHLRNKPGFTTAYESGELPQGSPWVPIQAGYVVLAFVFILFEVEVALMFPWAVAYKTVKDSPGALMSGFGFVLLLVLGLIYVWASGLITWYRPVQKASAWQGLIAPSRYEQSGLKKANKA